MRSTQLFRLARPILLLIAFSMPAWGQAASDCRNKISSKAASYYSKVASTFTKCAEAIASGETCSAILRDAKVQSGLVKLRDAVEAGCTDTVAQAFNYSSNDKFKVQVAGRAAGEGRYVADSLFGRAPSLMPFNEVACAVEIAKRARVAAKKHIKTLIRCSGPCVEENAFVDERWEKAKDRILKKCDAATLTSLLGTSDPSGHLTVMRGGAQRVVDTFSYTTPFSPFASTVNPGNNQVIAVMTFPVTIPVNARVAGVPHASYVTEIEVGTGGAGSEAIYNPATDQFDYTLEVFNVPPGVNYTIPLKAYTYLGVFNSTTNVKMNYGALDPGVVIESPPSGTVTSAGNVVLSGRIVGSLAAGPALTIAGIPTAYNPDGTWTQTVPLSTDSVQIIEAKVTTTIPTTSEDSTVILRGTSLPLTSNVPFGLFDRLNNTGFTAVKTLILTQLEGSLSPAAFGTPDSSCGTGYRIEFDGQGGCIDQFSFGTPGVPNPLGAQANQHIALNIDLPSFHIKLKNIDSGILGIKCDLTYDASNIRISVDADLAPDGSTTPPNDKFIAVTNTPSNPVDVIFTGSNASLSGGFLGICSLGELFADVEGMIEGGFRSAIQTELPAALNSTLGGIDISTPIANATGVQFSGQYDSIPEDNTGITFVLNENVVALNPAPNAPPITSTLLPIFPGPPLLGPNIPLGDESMGVTPGSTYDLAFCLTDGMVNRFMAAFMMLGMFNQEVSEFSGLALNTQLLSIALDDFTLNAACPNCPASIVLSPTAAPVARAPMVGEMADIVMTVPNYRIDIIADNAGVPMPLLGATIVFDLPLELGANLSTIAPGIGTPSVSNMRFVNNPFNVPEASLNAFEALLTEQFGAAAASLGSLFTALPLPEFSGLTPTGVGSGYNVSGVALYLRLN